MTNREQLAKGKSAAARQLKAAIEELLIFSDHEQLEVVDLALCLPMSDESRQLLVRFVSVLKYNVSL